MNRHKHIDQLHALRIFEGEKRAQLNKILTHSDSYHITDEQRSNLAIVLKHVLVRLENHSSLLPEQLESLYVEMTAYMGRSVSQLARMESLLK